MTTFSELHVPGRPLFLPNAWDVASAAALARAGYPAIGTTSLGVAAVNGLPDGARATREETLALARRLTPLPCLFTVDIEDGFSDDPTEVADVCAELDRAGAAGVNLEDALADPDRLSTIIAAVKRRVPRLFVNARTDTYWLSGDPSWTDTVRRARAYTDAGADGIFVPGPVEPEHVRELAAGVRLNLLYLPGGPDLNALAALGVSRVSTGSLLFRTALGAAVDAAGAVVDGRTPPAGGPSYADVQALLGPAGV